MANHKSAIKRIKQSEKHRIHNRIYRNRARTMVKKALAAIDGGDAASAKEATLIAIRDLDMAATKGIIHKNNAARRKSRLMKHLASLS